MHVIAAKAVAFKEALAAEFQGYQRQVIANAKALAAELADAGFRIVSGGTDNHLLLVDVLLRRAHRQGPRRRSRRAGITVNKNAIPFDTQPPMKASGIRIGTPALTTRGMKEDEMRQIAGLISEALADPEDESAHAAIRGSASKKLCERFPIYEHRLVRSKAQSECRSKARVAQEVFGPDGLIARHHSNYEYRPGQVEMAEAVDDALTDGGVALIEAGTGTGKTLAYLSRRSPRAAASSSRPRPRTFRSSSTRKTSRSFKRSSPATFRAACMKGRSNYLCLHRLKMADEMPLLQGLDEVDYFDDVRRWAGDDRDGRPRRADRPARKTSPSGRTSTRAPTPASARTAPSSMRASSRACGRQPQRPTSSSSTTISSSPTSRCAGGDYGAVLPDYTTIIFDEAHETRRRRGVVTSARPPRTSASMT